MQLTCVKAARRMLVKSTPDHTWPFLQMDGIKCNTFCGRVKMSLLLQKGPKADRKKRLKVGRQNNIAILLI